MRSLKKWLPFVKLQGERVAAIIAKHPEDKGAPRALGPVVRRYKSLEADIAANHGYVVELEAANERLQQEILRTREETSALQEELRRRNCSLDHLEIKPRELMGLPPELLKQLSMGEDLQEIEILLMIEEAGGAMTLDQVILAIWKKTKEVSDRAKMNSKLYRMAQKGLLFAVAGKKATYSIYESSSGLEGRNEPPSQ